MKINQEQAVDVARLALTFIAEDQDRIARFLALSGVGPTEIRARMQDPAFLAGVLDFLLGHEPDVLAFAEWAELNPELPKAARYALPGAEGME